MTPKPDRKLGCPVCGMMVTGKEKACPRCGKRFDKRLEYECPFCGTSIPQSSKNCPSCKIDLPAVSYNVETRSADKTVSELMSDLIDIESSHAGEENKNLSCPNCAQHLKGTEAKCPKCGRLLTGKLGLSCPICKSPVDERLTECPRCGISLDKVARVAKPMVPLDSSTDGKLSRSVGPSSRPSSHTCPLCGAIVPKSFQKCPLCSTDLSEAEPRADELAQKAETFDVPPQESSISASVKVDLQATQSMRTRRLKAAKATAVPVSSTAGSIGLTNGVSRVNGLGKVNGTGATNGRAFVNGTGISNGLGAQSKEISARRASFLTRWQFLAVLVAIVVVIPTFIFLSYSKESEEFSIDGDFADWDGVTTYGTKIPSTASSTNITEWAVATQSFDLFFYFKTQAHMMGTSNPESYYLFVDSDGSKETGYVIESIGADYMLQLMGWDSAINSSSVSTYSSSSDQYNWNAWATTGSLSYFMDFARAEARATLPVELGESARFLLVSKDSADRGSVSCTAPLRGGALVVMQAPSADVAEDGIVSRSTSVPMLTLRFKCEGEGGQVIGVDPSLVGAELAYLDQPFSLEKGEEREMTISVDTSVALDGQLVSAEVFPSSITSSFSSVEVIGSGAGAYVGVPHLGVAVDGAFADWDGRLSVDQDAIQVPTPSVDIDEVGNVNTSRSSFFYVSVMGEMCSGTFVPAMISKPSGAGGGGVVIPTRHTAEDILNIYVDSDQSNSTGEAISLNSKLIGADQRIEVRGLFGKITSAKELDYSSSGNWVESAELVEAAKDEKRIEIGVSADSLGGGADIDFIVETTSWKGRSDLAFFDPSSTKAMTRTWIVDSATTSSYATSMSYQRKMFYDGVNYWSFFFDGANTVHKYSVDDGQTWTYSGPVFTTSGVSETSIWYDSSTSTVYAVGDTSSATNNVSIQVGTVDAAAHTISWAPSDSSLNTSSFALAGKNTYICKDSDGYLWVLSSNCTQAAPAAYQLSAFKSAEINGPTSWVFSGQMLLVTSATDDVKGSIVPAGSGSDVWAVYAYSGAVSARKYTGVWQPDQTVYRKGKSMANTDNSPPSVVVDGKGVVHVVYGTGDKAGPASTPTIEYSHNDTDLTTFTAGVNLDQFIASGIGDYYPTISLETSTDNLYVLWLQSNDTTYAPRTVMGRKCVSGTWSNMTIEPQSSFTKQYLTSIYSISGEFKVCWQWTQNTTAPIEVLMDHQVIPEFGDFTPPIVGFIVIFAVYRQRSRSKEGHTG